MATIKCPAPGCDAEWPLATPTDVLTRLLDIHSATAHATSTHVHALTAAKAEKVRRPTITASGTSEEWAYFLRSTEETVLKNIKTLAVRQENIMVARVQLQQMRQDRDEPIRAFAARLRGQAGVCNFSIKCPCGTYVDYSDVMVRDVLINGLSDEEIRLDILGESKQDMTLEEALRYVEAKESGKRSATRLAEGVSKTSRPTTTPQNPSPNALDDAAATFDSLCSANALIQISQAHTVSLDHHVYNEFCKAWERRASDPQPFVNVTICAMPSDIQSLGFHIPISSLTRPVTFPAMADTGCQSCLAGLGLLTKMGLNRRHLLPVKMKMTAANHGAINIVGALALRISGTSPTNKKMNTRQMVYFTTATDRMFLNKQACIALGMIPPSFPTIGETSSANCVPDAPPHRDPNTSMQLSPTQVTAPTQNIPPICCHRRQKRMLGKVAAGLLWLLADLESVVVMDATCARKRLKHVATDGYRLQQNATDFNRLKQIATDRNKLQQFAI
ncbi:hypothetical protein PoB_004193700 [Plakobranchus ocellatus]|uniref:Uncharacterized protein n=1 Tax=Plakobranchus ocellatus TaxID=259542 RepID=A0AAV4B8E1_9GAST|nr:hypothetical protein PoB_004193700 [Plakobranchus ocellatus]